MSVNWQDGDSSSVKAILLSYPSAQIMHCAGHVGRAHSHQLNELKAKKTLCEDVFQYTPTE